MIGIVCGSELENVKGTHNKNLVRVLHHLSRTEKPLCFACSRRQKNASWSLQKRASTWKPARRNRGLGGPSTLDALCTRSCRSSRNIEVEGRQVSLSIFSATISVFELPTLTFAVPVAIDHVAPFSTSVRQAIMHRIRVARCKDTCFQFETETANPSSEKAERETLLRCTRVVFVQDGK